MTLRVVAVSAPDWIRGVKNASALNSRDPASLFNACRYAAMQCETPGPWANSNWATSRKERREKLLLMYSLDDMPAFEELLLRERPNLLLIGAMTLCLPGAIRCAERARALLGSEVFIVLGGRHTCETIYLAAGGRRSPESVQHHRASPLRLMSVGRIPNVFDLVISGDGEYLIAAIGNLVEAGIFATRQPSTNLDQLDRRIPGDWIAGVIDRDVVKTVVSEAVPLNYGALPSPCSMFGASASFDVFGGRITAHAFSDTGRGCVYNCEFCSERSGVVGGIRDLTNAADRLYRQFEDACQVAAEDTPGRAASAFVEDSVLLGGSPRMVERLSSMLEQRPLDLQFGAQLTIDQILRRQSEIARLAENGLRYLFVGIETLDPGAIGGMSKDVGRTKSSWVERIEQAFHFLHDHKIDCGGALLFGLGESRASRPVLFEQLRKLQKAFGAPFPLSINWAVQHPLCGDDGGAGYEYVEWGTPDSEFLECFHHYGEASVLYPLPKVGTPSLPEVQEVTKMFANVSDSQEGRFNASEPK